MEAEFGRKLDRYAELIVDIGLNLQPKQRLIIGVPEYNTGTPLEAAPLIRKIVEIAYKRGASLVDVIWGDDELLLARFQNATPETFKEVASWQGRALLETAQSGGAFLTVLGNDPDLLKDQDPEVVAQMQQAVLKNLDPAMDYVVRSAINWCVIGVSTPAWAAKVLPDVPVDQQVSTLWEHIFKMCRLDEEAPVQAWEEHGRQINARCEYMSSKGYSSLKLTAPGTDLTLGLPQGHKWCGAFMTRQDGLPYVANLPTEEIFTLPHRGQAEGHLTASMPLSYGGALMADFTLTFNEGQVVSAEAKSGRSILRKLLETDGGSNRLGEIALVPHSSPIAQTGRLFYNILIDENAATHCALGSAYKFSIEGGDGLSDEEFTSLGGNPSILHVDFMIGSEHMDVDGITEGGVIEPVMRAGEWAFEL